MASSPAPIPKSEPVETEELDASLDADPDVDMANAPPPPAAAPPGSSSDTTLPQTDGAGESSVAGAGADQAGQNAAAAAAAAAARQGEVRQEALDLSLQESRIPMRKDVSLREFLGKMDDYAPVIPDAVTFHALTLAGLPPPPLSAVQPASSSQTQTQTTQTQTTQTTGASTSTTANANANPPAASSQSQSQSQANGSSSTTTIPSSSSSEPYTPLPLARLLALATQKFVADIAADAYQYSRMRSGTLTSNTLSALSNPGAPGPGTGGAGGGTGGGGGAGAGASGGGGAGGGAGAGAGSKQAGQHVLGVQRPGFGGGGQGGQQGRTVLTMEDLGMAVGEYGVNVKRGEFYR